MKLFRKIFILSLFLLGLFFLSAYLVVRLQGRAMLQAQLSQVLKQDVRIGAVSFRPPLGLRMEDIEVGDMLTIQLVRVNLGFPLTGQHKIMVHNLFVIKPVLTIRPPAPDLSASAGPTADNGPQGVPVTAPDNAASGTKPALLGVWINDFRVHGGRVSYVSTDPDDAAQVQLEDIGLRVSSMSFPLEPVAVKFKGTTRIVSEQTPFSGSVLRAEGWINWPKRDMDAAVKIIEKNDRVGLAVDLKSVNNDMTVAGTVRVGGGPASGSEGGKGSLEDFVLGALQQTGVKFDLKMNVHTKMDQFKVTSLLIPLSGQVSVSGEGGSTKEDLRNIGKQFEDIGKKFYTENIQNPPANAEVAK